MLCFYPLHYYISKIEKGKNMGEGWAEPRTAYALLGEGSFWLPYHFIK